MTHLNLMGRPGHCEDGVASATYKAGDEGRTAFKHDVAMIGFVLEEVDGTHGKWLRALVDGKCTGEWTPREGGILAWSV